MSKEHPAISPELGEWIGRQRLFFVATSPLDANGHINVSPKGGDCFRVLGPLEAVYHDYTGSGAETIAHLRENGRIVLMFCAFEGPPKIVRLHGTGTVVTSGNERFVELEKLFPNNPGTRAFIHVRINRVSDSCGFSVPRFEYQSDRDNLERWAMNQGPEKLDQYRHSKNQKSIDGLPGYEPAL